MGNSTNKAKKPEPTINEKTKNSTINLATPFVLSRRGYAKI